MQGRVVGTMLRSLLIIGVLLFAKKDGFGQVLTEEVDLGVFNGETRMAIRGLILEGEISKASISSSSNAVEILTAERDSASSSTLVTLKIDFRERTGSFKDTISTFSNDDILKQTVLINYLVLDPVNDVFKSYRNEFWPFKSKAQVFNLQTGVIGDTLTADYDLFNFSGFALDLKQVLISDSLLVRFEPAEVANNSFTRMHLSLINTVDDQLGFKRFTVPLKQGKDTIAFLPIQYSLVPAKSNSLARLAITRDLYDYKVVSEGDLISEVILITNSGSELLEIFKVETNCECLTAELSASSIKPNTNAQLRIKFDTNSRGGLERKMITLFTNDPNLPVKNIVIKAHVK